MIGAFDVAGYLIKKYTISKNMDERIDEITDLTEKIFYRGVFNGRTGMIDTLYGAFTSIRRFPNMLRDIGNNIGEVQVGESKEWQEVIRIYDKAANNLGIDSRI